MQFSTHFNGNWLNKVLTSPSKPYRSIYRHYPYTAEIIIPNYKQRLQHHYQEIIHGNLDDFCQQSEIPPLGFEHFGVVIKFEQAALLALHDTDMALDNGLKALISKVGAVIIKNGYMDLEYRDRGHRARFPQLNFHIDRSPAQPTHYSMYSRDPFDSEQKFPRTSSTLFLTPLTAHLQAIKERQIAPNHKGVKSTYTLFTMEDMSQLRDNIFIEHRWNEPEGSGELSMLDNITAMHASYYPNPAIKGYKIGVRYLS